MSEQNKEAKHENLDDPEYRQFVQTVIDNIKKNGFPEKRVAFGLERLYEAAEKKNINLNKVLGTLDDIRIAHEKTPEKIIFFPKPEQQVAPSRGEMPQGVDPSMFSGVDPSLFANLDPSMFAGIDFSDMKNMSLPKMMAMVGKMMKHMTPEQLSSIKNMYDNMSDEQKSSLMDKAKDFGIFGKKDPTDE
ncbi:MAG: hypothetical protein JXR76_25340 [Deltaproteobacteria bacterium]|nr:hypothetical protein [Deltaproteobacteria bacterium]